MNMAISTGLLLVLQYIFIDQLGVTSRRFNSFFFHLQISTSSRTFLSCLLELCCSLDHYKNDNKTILTSINRPTKRHWLPHLSKDWLVVLDCKFWKGNWHFLDLIDNSSPHGSKVTSLTLANLRIPFPPPTQLPKSAIWCCNYRSVKWSIATFSLKEH